MAIRSKESRNVGLSESSQEDGGGFITADDLRRTLTAHSITDLLALVPHLRDAVGAGMMLDVGCGFGGVPMTVGTALRVERVYGMDRDWSVLNEARRKGAVVVHAELGEGAIPYRDGVFDLVTAFGMLDYLPSFDDSFREILRVLRPGGWFLASLPNLASWVNRLGLLVGYQPRDVEVSKEIVAGVAPYYRKRWPVPTGHLHSVTTKAFKELAQHFGFQTVLIRGSAPRKRASVSGLEAAQDGFLTKADRFIARWPSLARRFIYLGRKAA